MTEFHHYTNEELVRFVASKENPTPLEKELLERLIKLLNWRG